MVYTDGSRREEKIGDTVKITCTAGVFAPAEEYCHKIDPHGEGITNTINRAELAGIYAGAKHYLHLENHLTINTDSMCSLLQIQKFLQNPHKFKHHTHRDMLEAISQTLLDRCSQGTSITLQKVKAHTGIHGNEMADHIASKGFLPLQQGTNTQPHMEELTLDHIPNQPHTSYWWPHSTRPIGGHPHLCAHNTLQQTPHSIPNLSTRPMGIYQTLWEKLSPQLVPNCRNYIFASTIPPPVRGVITRYWYGCLYTQKMAHRFKQAPNDLCPMCKSPDSGTHLLGACTHPAITKHRIQRHNDVVRAIGRLLRLSTDLPLRNSHIIMDAGKAADAIIGNSEDHRIPQWMLPSLPKEQRLKLRPDLLCLTLPTDTTLQALLATLQGSDRVMEHLKDTQTIYLLEVSLCGDLRYEQHFTHKQGQHQLLKEALQAEGWTVKLLDPLLFGIGGSLYRHTTDILTTLLHIPLHHVNSTLNKIQVRAAHKAWDIVRARRDHDRPAGLGPLLPSLKRGKDYKG
jgi:ribonuclease HI